MLNLRQIANEIIERKDVEECFVTSDGVPFLKMEYAQKHAIKNRITYERFVKRKKKK